MRDLASVGGLDYRLVRKHARTEMLGLLISMFLGLGYMSMCPNSKCSICIQFFWLFLGDDNMAHELCTLDN